MRRIVWALLMFTAGLAAIAPAGRASAGDFDRVLPLSKGGQFLLQNVNGSVEIDGWEREQVEVQATKTGRRASELDLVNIDVHSEDNLVTVHTLYPHGDGVEVAVDYKIHVPYRVLLSVIETVNGDVRVSGIEGAGFLRSVNGDVEVLSSAGRFSAKTTNGSVHLDLRQLPGGRPMEVSTVNGTVLLELPTSVNAELRVENLNGNFDSEMPIREKTSLSSKGFSGRLGAGGSEVILNSTNGDIRIKAGRPLI